MMCYMVYTFLYNCFEYQTISILSNTIILSKFLINLPNLPIYQHFTLSCLLCPYPSPPPQNLPIYTDFSTKYRTSFKMPKNPNYFLPDHTQSNHPKQKEFLKNEGFLLLPNIFRSHSTERRIVKLCFNYFILQTLL